MIRVMFPIDTIDLRRSFHRQLSHLAGARPLALRPRLTTGLPLRLTVEPPIGAPFGRREPNFTRLDDRPTGGPRAALRRAAAGAARAEPAVVGGAAGVAGGASVADRQRARVRRGVDQTEVGLLGQEVVVVVQGALRVELGDDERPLVALPVLAGGVADEHVVDEDVLRLCSGGDGE